MASDPSPSPSSHDFDQISSLGKYKIQRKVGSGGMGAVYLAVDQQLKRTVALKVLPRDKASNQVLVRRFKAEGQAGAQLEHPNIVSVFESGEIDGYLYLAMEFVEGIDAYELLRKRGILPVKRSLDIIKQVTLALQHAHERQIVHRDIKPSNLMIRERDGVVKLADMGLARIIEDEGESAITKAGTTVGTVDYMSPEQGRDSKAADIRSDIYSLGCTWYHLLTGKPPFPEGDLMNKLRAHALQAVPDPRGLNENIPSGVVAVLQRMMAKKADDRYQTPAQLLTELSSPALLRADFSAEQLQLLAATHQTQVEEDDQDIPEEAASSPRTSGTRRRSAESKAARLGRPQPSPAERTGPEEEEEDDVAGRIAKPKAKKNSARDSLPARVVLDPASSESDESKRIRPGKNVKSERALPGRIDKPLLSEPPSTRLDPNTIKLVLLSLVIMVAVGGVIYAVIQNGGTSADKPLTGNPYLKGESLQETPGATVPPAPAADPGTAADATSMVAQEADPAEGEASTNSPGTSTPTMTSSNDDIDQTPFAGSVPYVADGKGVLPQWVWESRRTIKAATTRVIRRSAPADGEFRSLGEALTVSKGETVFQFADAGPHEIPAFELKQPRRWTLQGAENITPVLILRSANAPIVVQQGILTLRDVHLVVLPEQSSAGLRIESGTIDLRNSTITHLSPSATELIVAEANGRVLLENSVVRGMGDCRPITLKGANSSCVAGQSVLIAGNASAIELESTDAGTDRRLIALISSVSVSGRSGIRCQHMGKQPPACDLKLQGSILAYVPGHFAEATGIEFQGWPTGAESLDRPRVSYVNWTAERSAFVGWPHWVQLGFADGSPPVDIRDEEAWRTFWRQSAPTGQLIPTGADLKAVSDANALASCEQLQAGLAGIRTELADAGPKWSDLPEPPQSVLANVLAFGQSASIAESLLSPSPGKELEFDLSKPTLGRFINSEECPDGSTVIAFGAGLKTIDPFVVRQKRVQVVFRQTEGTPLKLQPGYKTEPGTKRPAAWFSVEEGQLTLSQGSFRLNSNATRSYPERFLQLTGGAAALRNCRVEGVDTAWPMLDALPSEGHAPPQVFIDHSLIVGQKTLLRIGAAESIVEVRDSILSSSSGAAVLLDSGSAGTQCLLQGSTISAGKAAYQIMPAGVGGPIELFARESVFQGGGVVALETDASAIHWWGLENAYASGMKTFLWTQSQSGPQDFTRDWVKGWGAGHELLPVFGPNTTLLPTPPSNVSDILPESFQLHAQCAAANAGADGGGLGSPIADVGPSRTAASSAMKPGKKPGPVAPSGTKPKAPNF